MTRITFCLTVLFSALLGYYLSPGKPVLPTPAAVVAPTTTAPAPAYAPPVVPYTVPVVLPPPPPAAPVVPKAKPRKPYQSDVAVERRHHEAVAKEASATKRPLDAAATAKRWRTTAVPAPQPLPQPYVPKVTYVTAPPAEETPPVVAIPFIVLRDFMRFMFGV